MDSKLDTMDLKEVFNRGIINRGNLSRMKHVMEKAASGASIKVAFIGGSITAGAASTSPKTCYAYQVYRWWKFKFPQSTIEYLNAGVGATTSKFGVARVEQDVLQMDPDVVFAEFSVNDSDTELFEETFEGLIRKILLHSSKPALFMFNNVFYDDGRNAQRVHNKIGKYYDLPIVSIKESIYHMIEQGIMKNTDISADNLHPNDIGHKLIADTICNLLDRIYDTITQTIDISDDSVPVKPVTSNRYGTSIRWYNKNTDPILNGFYKDEIQKNGVWDVFRNGWSAGKMGSSIRFEVEGTMISAQYRKYAAHPAPIAKMIIDDDTEHAVILDGNFDETWGDALFLQDVMVDGPSGRHIVEIILTKEVQDKEFYLASIITV